MGERPAARFSVTVVPFDDPAAVVLREASVAEARLRYWDHGGADWLPSAQADAQGLAPYALWTAIATDAAGLPVGHVMLRRVVDGAGERADLAGVVELKRFWVAAPARGHGVGTLLMDAAETAARDLGARRIVLHTGRRQPEAVALYERRGYTAATAYPPYPEGTHDLFLALEL